MKKQSQSAALCAMFTEEPPCLWRRTQSRLLKTQLLKKPSRLKSSLRRDFYVVDGPCNVGAHACDSRRWAGLFSNLNCQGRRRKRRLKR